MVQTNLLETKMVKQNVEILFSAKEQQNGLSGEYSLSMPAERYRVFMQCSDDDCEQEPFENMLLSDEAWKVLNPAFDGSFKEAQKKPFPLKMRDFDNWIHFLALETEKEEISSQLENGSELKDCCVILTFVKFMQLTDDLEFEEFEEYKEKIIVLFHSVSDFCGADDALYGIALTQSGMRNYVEFDFADNPKLAIQLADSLLKSEFGLALIPEEWNFMCEQFEAYHDPVELPDGSQVYLVDKDDIEPILFAFTGNFVERNKNGETIWMLPKCDS